MFLEKILAHKKKGKRNSLLFIMVILFFYACYASTIAFTAVYQPFLVMMPLHIILPFISSFVVEIEPFERYKISTLVFGNILVILVILGSIPVPFFVLLVPWLLRLNIVEAMVEDYTKKRYFNLYNGVLLLLLTIPLFFTWDGYLVSMHLNGIIYWIIMYTLWNWNFVLARFSNGLSMFHIAVLAAPIVFIISTLNPMYWLASRGYTLTLSGIMHLHYKEQISQYLYSDTLEKYKPKILSRNVQGFLSLVFTVLAILMVRTF